MTELTAEMRRSVAEAVTSKKHRWGTHDNGSWCLFQEDSLRAYLLVWRPDDDVYQKDALITKTAQLIKDAGFPWRGPAQYSDLLVGAMATSAVHDIELLCHELLEAQ